ncbi:MAG: amidohydrolase family protein [Bdellovibrionales bacterium]|nr:amidohydrolase family protein [Bdellovibrionales bacterium]
MNSNSGIKNLSLKSILHNDSFVLWNISVVSPNKSIENAFVAISNGKIINIGSLQDYNKSANYADWPKIELENYILAPGFINAHTHVAMSAFQNLCYYSDLNWQRVFKKESKINSNNIEALSNPSIYSAVRSGVVGFVDHYYFSSSVGKAFDKWGVKALIGESIADQGGAFPNNQSFERAKEQLNWTAKNCSSNIQNILCPHASDTVSKQLFKKILDLSKSENLGLHYHLAQSKKEYDYAKKEYGKTPTEYLNNLGLITDQTLAVHCLFLEETDFKILKSQGAMVGVCPLSQMSFEKLVDLKTIMNLNIPWSLGTDAVGFNDHMDIIEEMRICSIMSKELNLEKDFHLQALSAATKNLAKYFNLKQKWNFSGTLEEGDSADCIFIKKDMRIAPITDLKKTLVYSVNSSHIQHVMVNGDWVLFDQKPVKVSEEEMEKDYQLACKVIL